jgi:hypothetical protein
MKYCLGIDPGQTGAIAWVSEDLQNYGAIRWKDDIVTTAKLFRERLLSQDLIIVLAVLEKVSAMKDWGVTSTFKFGGNFGAWQGILAMAEIPFTFVSPQKWQKEMWDSERKGLSTKQLSTGMVRRMFPKQDLTPGQVKTDHSGIADATLLAWYGIKMLKGGLG